MNYDRIIAGLTNLLPNCEVLRASQIVKTWSGVAIEVEGCLYVMYASDHKELSVNSAIVIDKITKGVYEESVVNSQVFPNYTVAIAWLLRNI